MQFSIRFSENTPGVPVLELYFLSTHWPLTLLCLKSRISLGFVMFSTRSFTKHHWPNFRTSSVGCLIWILPHHNDVPLGDRAGSRCTVWIEVWDMSHVKVRQQEHLYAGGWSDTTVRDYCIKWVKIHCYMTYSSVTTISSSVRVCPVL